MITITCLGCGCPITLPDRQLAQCPACDGIDVVIAPASSDRRSVRA